MTHCRLIFRVEDTLDLTDSTPVLSVLDDAEKYTCNYTFDPTQEEDKHALDYLLDKCNSVPAHVIIVTYEVLKQTVFRQRVIDLWQYIKTSTLKDAYVIVLDAIDGDHRISEIPDNRQVYLFLNCAQNV